jgi:hypothetical protein
VYGRHAYLFLSINSFSIIICCSLSELTTKVTVVVRGNPKLCVSAEPFGTKPCSDLAVVNAISLFVLSNSTPFFSRARRSNSNSISDLITAALDSLFNTGSISIIAISAVNGSNHKPNSTSGTNSNAQEFRITYQINLGSNYSALTASSTLQAQGALQMEKFVDFLNNGTNSSFVFLLATASEIPSFDIASDAISGRVLPPTVKVCATGTVSFSITLDSNETNSLSGHYSIAYRTSLPSVWPSRVSAVMNKAKASSLPSWGQIPRSVSDARVSSFHEQLTTWSELPFISQGRVSLAPCSVTSRANACLRRGVRYDVRLVGRWPSEVLYSDMVSVLLPLGDPVPL